MKDRKRRFEELTVHVRNSSIETIYQELVEAGLHTYANTENVINDDELELKMISESAYTFTNHDFLYEDVGNEVSIPNKYSLAS